MPLRRVALLISCICFHASLVAWQSSDQRYVHDAKYPFQDTSLPWNDRVDDLIGRLTLKEIVNQSQALYNHAPLGIDRLGIKPYQWITECLRGYTDRNATAFPEALGLAAAFSRELIFNVSHTASEEVRAYYNTDVKQGRFGRNGLSCLSPVINIARHPFWGRNQETYGEDPYLTGELITQYVKGLQGDDPRYVRANAGCKHFAAYAGPENVPTSRFSFDAKVSERDLRMTFWPQFRACVRAGTYNVMCSYNRVNGVPSCVNKHFLTDVLRKEWGFQGFVISDADALEFVITWHKYLSTLEETVAAAVKSGCNLELSTTGVVVDAIPKAIEKGLLTASDVAVNLKPVFYTRMRLGEFDPPSMNPYTQIDMSVVLSAEHREMAIQAASMSFVLLKNLKGYLPITRKIPRLAIVGPFADNPAELFGGYTPRPDSRYVTTPLEGLRGLSDDTHYASGCDNTRCLQYNSTDIKQAVIAANFVIVCLGTGINVEQEGNDRFELDLPGQQLQLLKDAIFYSREAPLLLLLFTTGPVDTTFATESAEVDAILVCFYPAQGTGDALYRTLTASGPHSVPAARLPITWPAQIHQVPPITDYNMTAGQTYRYFNGDPLYPFGYGLSYSKFHYVDLTVTPSKIVAGQNVTVTVQVVNTGPHDADEVVQLYMSWCKSPVPVPRWTLVGFDRVTLEVHTAVMVTFVVNYEQMQVWLDDSTGFVILPGDMTLYAGGQQPMQRVSVESNVLQATFTVTAN